MGDKNLAKQLLDAGDLMGAGKELGIDPVMRARGHAFDESKDSYTRRLLAEFVGAEAAGAMVRGEEPMQDPDDDDYPQESEGAEKEEAAVNEPTQAPDGASPPDAATVAAEVAEVESQAEGDPADTGVAANEGGADDQPGDPNVPATSEQGSGSTEEQLP